MNTINIYLNDTIVRVNDDEETPYEFTKHYRDKVSEGELEENELYKVGKNIFDAIFSTEKRLTLITKKLSQLKDGKDLFLNIVSESENVHNIPFELINSEGNQRGFLLKRGNVHLSRTLTTADKDEDVKLSLPIRILVLISMPLETYEKSPLDPLKELEKIYTSLREYIDRGIVEIDVEEKVSEHVVRQRLLEKRYDIVHFTGHGSRGGKLIVEDDNDFTREKLISSDELRALFNGSGVKLFFFNACETALASALDPSLAFNIYNALPECTVIANIVSVYDTLATQTTKHIYDTILTGKSVGTVLYKTRLELQKDWWKPVFFGIPTNVIAPVGQEVVLRTIPQSVIVRPAETIKNYVYRYGIVREASNLIEKGKYLVLHGIGGAGKSTLAVYLSKFFSAKFRHHLFFDISRDEYSTPEKILDAILSQARRTRIISNEVYQKILDDAKILQEKERHYDKFEFIKTHLSGRTFIILDNLETIAQDTDGIIKQEWFFLFDELMKNENYFVILTSRLRPFLTPRQPLDNILEIGEYTKAEFGFLLQSLDGETQNFLVSIHNELQLFCGYHPLSISKFIETKFEEAERLFEITEFKSVFEFYRNYFDKHRGETAKLFLFQLPISLSLFREVFSADFEDLLNNKLLLFNKETQNEYVCLYKVIRKYFLMDYLTDDILLTEGSLQIIDFFEMKKSSPLDRVNILLILLFCYERTNNKILESKITSLFNKINFEQNPNFSNSLINAFEKIFLSFELSDELTSETFNTLGMAFQYASEIEKSLVYHHKSLKLKRKMLGDMHPDVAISYNNLGSAYHFQGNYRLAHENYEKALEIKLSTLVENDPFVATLYNNIGGVHDSEGAHLNALEYYMKALKIRTATLKERHIDFAGSYNNIGAAYHSLGNYSSALEYYFMAFDLQTTIYGKIHTKNAMVCNNIGSVYKEMGDYQKALKFYWDALEIKIKTLGEINSNTAITYCNIGILYVQLGDLAKAMKYQQKGLEIFKITIGETHDYTATAYSSIGSLYYSLGDYTSALKYYEKGLAIKKLILDKNHMNIAISYNNIALVYNTTHQYSKALEYYMGSLETLKTSLGEFHPTIAISYNNIAGVYSSQGNYKNALKYLAMGMKIYKKYGDETNPHIATSYHNIGNVYRSMGEYKKATKHYRKELTIYEKFRIYHRVFICYGELLTALIQADKIEGNVFLKDFLIFLEYTETHSEQFSKEYFEVMLYFVSGNIFTDEHLQKIEPLLKNNVEKNRFTKFVNILDEVKQYIAENPQLEEKIKDQKQVINNQ